MQSPRGGAGPENRETTQGSRGMCKLSSLVGGSLFPLRFVPWELLVSNLTIQLRFWSLLLIHVESLSSLGQREDVEM